MPSFDVVSEVDEVEIRHGAENTARELSSRFDFRGVDAAVDHVKGVITLRAESDFQCQQLLDMLQTNLAKRGIDPYSIDADETPVHSGKTFALSVRFKQGIETEISRKIVKLLKQSKNKIQVAIQGDKVRVNGKKRDNLQAAIALIKQAELGQPFQFNNFRD